VSRRKASFPIVAAYAVLPPKRRQRLIEAFALRSDDATLEVRALLDEAGGAELTRTAPLRFAEKAIAVVASCDVPAQFFDDFDRMARYVASRSH
jgi:geranylgeranyl pyrophosphate synthase